MQCASLVYLKLSMVCPPILIPEYTSKILIIISL